MARRVKTKTPAVETPQRTPAETANVAYTMAMQQLRRSIWRTQAEQENTRREFAEVVLRDGIDRALCRFAEDALKNEEAAMWYAEVHRLMCGITAAVEALAVDPEAEGGYGFTAQQARMWMAFDPRVRELMTAKLALEYVLDAVMQKVLRGPDVGWSGLFRTPTANASFKKMCELVDIGMDSLRLQHLWVSDALAKLQAVENGQPLPEDTKLGSVWAWKRN